MPCPAGNVGRLEEFIMLTDQEIDAVAAKIVAEVTKKTGGMLRG